MRKWIPLLIIAAAVIASAAVYPKLPLSVPTHWDMVGRPNGWSSRLWGAWVMPILLVVIWLSLRFLPAIDPRGSNYSKFGDAFNAIVSSIMLFMLGMHFLILRAALGHPVAMERVVPIGVGALFVVIGNFLPQARPNWFVGIRTPWTLSSDRVWEKTHRFGGRVFVASGIVVIFTGLITGLWANIVMAIVVALCTISVLAYSYIEWKRELPRQAPATRIPS
ncbi:MAG TPA: SdpI family protein [Gemmatimonadaceae bacterium]